MVDTYRVTFTVTPLTDTETQQVIDDLRARFGRKPLIHIVGRQPSGTQVKDAPKGPAPLPESSLVVLRYLAAGYTSRQIATRLRVSNSCVNQRVYRAKQHLGLTRYNTARLVLEAHRLGLLTPTQEVASV